MARSRRVTTRDVAKRAGVSSATVSFVLNDRRDITIPEETRERVRQAAHELGYRPNLHARSLRRGATRAVGFVLNDITNPGLAQTVRTVSQELTMLGYGVMLLDSNDDAAREYEHILTLVDYQVAALVVTGEQELDTPATQELIRLATAGFPVVSLSVPIPGSPVPSIAADQERIGYLATHHLIERGHQRIGFLAGYLRRPIAELGIRGGRYHGYARALTEAGLSVDPSLVAAATDPALTTQQALAWLLAASDPPTAVVATSDRKAALAMKTAQEQGRRVPDDLAFVGVGNSPLCELIYPSLTSVAQPHEEYARHLLALLRDMLAGRDDWRGRTILTTPYLVARDSSRLSRTVPSSSITQQPSSGGDGP
jgi:DNA-binding LacI/PurR family transcriptional regulator